MSGPKPIPKALRTAMRNKLAHAQVLEEELAVLYENQKPLTREQAAMAAGLLVRLGNKVREALELGAKIQRLLVDA